MATDGRERGAQERAAALSGGVQAITGGEYMQTCIRLVRWVAGEYKEYKIMDDMMLRSAWNFPSCQS